MMRGCYRRPRRRPGPRRAIPESRDLEAKREALRLGRELLRGTKYEEEA